MNASRSNAYLSVLAAIIVWGVAPAFARDFSKTFGPWDAMFIRLVSVALMCLPLLFFSGIHIERKDWPRLLLVSVIGMFFYFLGSIYGFGALKAGVAGLIIAVQPLIIALLATVIGTQRLTLSILAGLIISFLGAVYLVSGDLTLAGDPGQVWFGIAMLLLADVAFAINVVFSQSLVRKYGAMKITLLTMILTALPALFFYRTETPHIIASLGLHGWSLLFFLGFIGTIVVVVMWNYAVGLLPPTTMGASLYAIPPLAAIAGYFILKEMLTPQIFIAGALILLGVAVSEFGKELTTGGKIAGIIALLLAVCAWGMVPVATRFLVQDIPPQFVMILRVVPSGLLGLLLGAYFGAQKMPWRAWMRVIIAAVVGNMGYQILSIFGAHYIPASWTGMLFGLEPVFIAIFAILFAGDRLTGWLIGGLSLAIAGTIVMALGSLTGTMKDVNVIGILLVTLGTMGWGIYTVMVRPVTHAYGAVPVACLTLGISAFPALLFLTPAMPATLAALSVHQVLVIAGVVIFCTIGGTVAWNFGLQHLPSSTAGMFLYVQPIVAACGGILLLNEQISSYLLAGGTLIIGGVMLSQIGPLLRPRSVEFFATAEELR